jgi:hypothetical protein
MSLEEKISALQDSIDGLNETMKIMVSKAKAAAGDAGASGDTGAKKTRATKAKGKDEESSSDGDTGEGEGNGDGKTDGIDVAALKEDIRTWMQEFGKGDDNAEYVARGTAFRAALDKLGAKKLDEVSADNLPKVVKWLGKKKAEGKLAAPAEEDDEL